MTCVQYMMDSGTSQGVGGDTLVPCRGSGGRLGGTESVVSGANVHPAERRNAEEYFNKAEIDVK